MEIKLNKTKDSNWEIIREEEDHVDIWQSIWQDGMEYTKLIEVENVGKSHVLQ